MTDGYDQALVDAVLNMLGADGALRTFDGEVPPATDPPYVLVYTTVGRPSYDSDNSIDGLSRVFSVRFYCHCVGGSARAARAVAQRVRTQLLDKNPVVAGLSCGKIREMPHPPPPHRDEATGSLIIDAVQVYELRASS